MIQAEDKERISSTRIRNGEIDREGHLYKSEIRNPKSEISEELRQELKKPLGTLIVGDPLNLEKIIPQAKEAIQKLSGQGLLITVGDEVTKLCNEMEFVPDLAIFDLHVNRLKKYEKSTHTMFHNVNDVKMEEVVNPSGTIQSNLVNKVSAAIQDRIKTGKKQLIHVIGEDDLAGVPVVLLAPLGSVVLYGQPGKGMVVVDVTEEKKDELARMMEKYR
jgi:uncharacterized protein (UPF0218 family)